MNYYKIKRRLRSEWNGLKSLLGKKSTKIAIKSMTITYEIIKIAYNPWYLLEYVFKNKLIEN